MCIWPGSAAWLRPPLSYGITAHYPGYFYGCRFDQALSSCIRRFCSCIFQAIVKEARTALLWEYVFTLEVDGRWRLHSIWCSFSVKSSRISPRYFTCFYSMVKQASLRDPWARASKHNMNCGRIPPFTTTEVNPSFK